MKTWYKIGTSVIICQLAVLFYGYLFLNSIDLEVFVNLNFYFGLVFLMAGLLIMISRNGFFDVITKGIRHVFFRKQLDQDEEEYRSVSTLLNFSSDWIIGSGVLLLGVSLISYFFGYQY